MNLFTENNHFTSAVTCD